MDETDELDVEREADTQAKGNEVTATTVIEATRPMTILLTPILVKIVQELAEEIIKDVSVCKIYNFYFTNVYFF